MLRSTNHEGCGYHFFCTSTNHSHTSHVIGRIVERENGRSIILLFYFWHSKIDI